MIHERTTTVELPVLDIALLHLIEIHVLHDATKQTQKEYLEKAIRGFAHEDKQFCPFMYIDYLSVLITNPHKRQPIFAIPTRLNTTKLNATKV